ncbi:hypothetical protein TL5118_02178 [Thalassovita autumnalis]|uniref:SIR2-like domain-containing protein n=1 Tax=Thalassovita autumnalis TaxID=2072972 RepID=A0A0P1FHM6_9RHOB|nr:hypothetical protein [Thalassovita autumnalis]CUH67406.1 hypothetical protein TL5118_02178 [Thalassovita autumnalis]CUH73876.1 hypothetical protein TL5120_03693 [Thalassovita autumnalis]
MRKLYIFGNGLGRAFDNDFYSLKRALEEAWSEEGPLNDDERALIANCLSDGAVGPEMAAPTEEAQLRDLQRVVDACDLIAHFQERANCDEAWLTGNGEDFPNAVRRYFHHAASQFHSAEHKLPPEFAQKFRAFVERDRPHIATLNYDDLLYGSFVETPIAQQHLLRDGFLRGKFDFEFHKRLMIEGEGWFLHLHGSPLFIRRGGKDRKITRAELPSHLGYERTHLVLTDAKSKPGAINSSAILRRYWAELAEILKQPVAVTLFGYGGADLHLNRLISEAHEGATIRVVSRTPDDENSAKAHWECLFRSRDLEFLFLDNILDLQDW